MKYVHSQLCYLLVISNKLSKDLVQFDLKLELRHVVYRYDMWPHLVMFGRVFFFTLFEFGFPIAL